MGSPEHQGGEPDSIGQEWSRKRAIRREELLAENPSITPRQMTALLWDYVPFKAGVEVSAYEHAGSDPGMSNPDDAKDAFQLEAIDPVADDIEARLLANRKAFHQSD